MAQQYRCIRRLVLDCCDSDGYFTDEPMIVEVGEVFEARNRYPFNIVGGAECVHLENDDGRWIEILSDTLAEHFEEATP